jgi:ParB/RepB/Spo0J family partition protein
MKFRDHPGVQGKRDAYPFDPRLLKVDPAYNVRDLTTPEALEKLEELKASIIENGVRTPLEVRLEGEDVFVISGHRRLAATLTAIAEGVEIKSIPVIPEPKNTSEIERCLNLVVSNDGEPLKPLEIAEVCRRLVVYGWDHQQIARRMGRKSSQWVKNHLDMLALPAEVQQMVKREEVAATEAVKVHKKEKGEAVTTLKAAKQEAESRGKKKVTAKAIKRVSPPKTNSAGRGKEDALCDFASVADKAQSYAQMDGGTPSQEHTQEIVTALGAALDKAKGKGIKPPEQKPAPVPGGMNGHAHDVKSLIAALKPFAEYCETTQLTEGERGDIINIRAEYVFDAAAAYRAALGGEDAHD